MDIAPTTLTFRCVLGCSKEAVFPRRVTFNFVTWLQPALIPRRPLAGLLGPWAEAWIPSSPGERPPRPATLLTASVSACAWSTIAPSGAPLPSSPTALPSAKLRAVPQPRIPAGVSLTETLPAAPRGPRRPPWRGPRRAIFGIPRRFPRRAHAAPGRVEAPSLCRGSAFGCSRLSPAEDGVRAFSPPRRSRLPQVRLPRRLTPPPRHLGRWRGKRWPCPAPRWSPGSTWRASSHEGALPTAGKFAVS